MKKPTIVMQSDFGIDSGLVACMHGMCRLVDSELETHDITLLIPAFDIEAASYCLQYTVPFWPDGTVFVSVVDPGVGNQIPVTLHSVSGSPLHIHPVFLQPDLLLLFRQPYLLDFQFEKSLRGTTSLVFPAGFFHSNL